MKFDHRITFYKGKSYSSDCIRRIAQNVSISLLRIQLAGSENFHREILNLIKEFEIRHLDLEIEYAGTELRKEIMVDSFILDLSRACTILSVNDLCEKITPEALHRLCKMKFNMIECSMKLRTLSLGLRNDQCLSFLKLIGINYRDDAFFSNKDIEVHEWNEDNEFDLEYSIFDGYLEIQLTRGAIEGAYGYLLISLWDTQDGIQREKNSNPGTHQNRSISGIDSNFPLQLFSLLHCSLFYVFFLVYHPFVVVWNRFLSVFAISL